MLLCQRNANPFQEHSQKPETTLDHSSVLAPQTFHTPTREPRQLHLLVWPYDPPAMEVLAHSEEEDRRIRSVAYCFYKIGIHNKIKSQRILHLPIPYRLPII